MANLAFEHLSFCYPGAARPALEDVSFGMEAGEFVVVCGLSGCGKTTLLRLVKPQLAPHGQRQGRILYGGAPLEELPEARSAAAIGFVMQTPDNQIVTDTVWHELAFGLENTGLRSEEIRRRVGEMAGFFGIDAFFRQSTASLSGGQKQLLNLASVLVMQPQLLVLDEPTSQLDPIAASEFIGMLQKVNRELGVGILLVEHRLEEVFPLADRVLLLDEGRLALYSEPRAFGRALRAQAPRHGMLAGLPSALRIHHGLAAPGPSPLTVREGRRFLSRYAEAEGIAPQAPPAAPPPRPHGGAVLEAKQLWFRYEKHLPDILEELSLTLYGGELLAILGGNGAGKSTLLKLLSAQQRPRRGKIKALGQPLKAYKNGALYRSTLALLPQNPQALFLKPTLREDYAELLSAMGITGGKAAARSEEMAEQLGITALLPRHPYDLSGGEQQKAALGKVLLTQPRILLLDEPTKGLDAEAKQTLAAILGRLMAGGLAVLMVTHDVEFAAEHAGRCALLFNGQLSAPEAPRAFFAGNTFYTTAAARMARHLFPAAITCADVLAACRPETEALHGRNAG